MITATRLLVMMTIAAWLAMAVGAAEQKVYVVGLDYRNGTISFGSVVVSTAFGTDDSSDGSYRLDVASFSGEVLYSTHFDFSLDADFSPPPPDAFDESGRQIRIPEALPRVLNESFVQLFVPYFAQGRELLVYDGKGAIVARESVAHFANLCNDGVCQDSESYESCQADCPSGGYDDYCDSVADGRCDVDCAGWKGKDSDCADEAGVEPAQSGSNFAFNTRMLVILGGVITAISGMVVLFARLRNRKEGKS